MIVDHERPDRGVVLGGKYVLVRRLATGTMGELWVALNNLTDRQVALKLIRPALVGHEEVRARILREARAAGRIEHRNVVQSFDVGQTSDGDPFLVMPLLVGENLAERIERQGPLLQQEACRVARVIAKGLAAAHAQGVVHRDLKPANVFLHMEEGSDEPVVKLLDFGVSKVAQLSDAASSCTGVPLGSPAYMSPEQALGLREVDHRADLWAFGVLLFEMIAGERPFDGPTVFAVVDQVLRGAIPRLDAFVPEVHPGLAELVARCLERNVAQRLADAAELVEALRPLAEGPRGPIVSDALDAAFEPPMMRASAPSWPEQVPASVPSGPSSAQIARGEPTQLLLPSDSDCDSAPTRMFRSRESGDASAPTQLLPRSDSDRDSALTQLLWSKASEEETAPTKMLRSLVSGDGTARDERVSEPPPEPHSREPSRGAPTQLLWPPEPGAGAAPAQPSQPGEPAGGTAPTPLLGLDGTDDTVTRVQRVSEPPPEHRISDPQTDAPTPRWRPRGIGRLSLRRRPDDHTAGGAGKEPPSSLSPEAPHVTSTSPLIAHRGVLAATAADALARAWKTQSRRLTLLVVGAIGILTGALVWAVVEVVGVDARDEATPAAPGDPSAAMPFGLDAPLRRILPIPSLDPAQTSATPEATSRPTAAPAESGHAAAGASASPSARSADKGPSSSAPISPKPKTLPPKTKPKRRTGGVTIPDDPG